MYFYIFMSNCNHLADILLLLFSDLRVTALIISAILGVYWIFYVPCNWTKSLQSVGYMPAVNSINFWKRINSCKQHSINGFRRPRLIGITELPPPYPNGWYCILESSSLIAKNVTYVSCLGEHFVVFRTFDGQVNVLDAYCPHLGANMGLNGQVKGDNIECPFHQWSFRGSDGTCANIPYSHTEPKGIKVRKWICREINDGIFIWYHSENEKNHWELPFISAVDNKELVFHGRNEFYINCHIQEIPENGADLAHFPSIHKAFLLTGLEKRGEHLISRIVQHHWEAIWSTSVSPKTHVATLDLKHSIHLFPKFNILEVNVQAKQIGPSFVHLHLKSSLFGQIEILQTITPVEPLIQKVVHRFYAQKFFGPLIKLMIFAESVMFERDIVMWNNKTYRNKPQLVKEDAAIKNFRNWFSQFYTENSKSFLEARSALDW